MRKYDNNSTIVAVVSTCIVLITILYSLISWHFKESEVLAKDYLKQPTRYEVDTLKINNIIIGYNVYERKRRKEY